ncbi:EAL domain-containing protein, partial [Mycobacterium tuberculosis]|nr:EAL domain-containing protein [Mycobacterium tuberculosis]
FTASVESAAAQASRLEQRLRLAIRDRRICCAYQPKVDFRADRVVGVEVLMRWRDEDGLIRAPEGMVELAVELGLMDDLTRQI